MNQNLLIGAGLSGLSASYFLEKYGNSTNTLLEKDNRTGGRVYSLKKGNTIIESGAQYLAGADREALKLIREINPKIVHAHSDIKATFVYDGKKSGVPINLFLRIHPFKTLRIVEAIIKTMTINAQSDELQKQFFTEWYIDTFGEDTLWFFGGIIQATTTPVDKISAWNGINILQAMFSTPYSVEDGLSGMVNALSNHLTKTKIHMKKSVDEIEIDGERISKIVTSDGKVLKNFDTVISSINANQLSKLIPAKEYRSLSSVPYSTCAYTYIETSKPLLGYGENVAFSDLNSPIVSILNRSTAEKFQYGLLTIKPELCNLSDEKLTKKMIAETNKIIEIDETDVITSEVYRWENALPILNPKLHQLQKEFANLPIKNLILSGDYVTFPSMEGAIISGKRAAQKAIDSQGKTK